jgi:hypothetical protein
MRASGLLLAIAIALTPVSVGWAQEKKISGHPFKAPPPGLKSTLGTSRPAGGGVTFGPRKGAPTLLTNSTPDFSLKSPTVNVVFHGDSWKDADKQAVVGAVKTIIGSLYLSALNQPNYGGDGKAVWGTSSTSGAALALDQGNRGARYPSRESLAAFIGAAGKNSITIAVNEVPSSDGAVGVNYSQGMGTAGSHVYVGTRAVPSGGALDMNAFTEVVSHEIAEAMVAGVQISDPGNFGMGKLGNQVADNEPEVLGYYAKLEGTSYVVQAYWSVRDSGWVIPGGAAPLKKAPKK